MRCSTRCARGANAVREAFCALLLAGALALLTLHGVSAAEPRGAVHLVGTVVSSNPERSLAEVDEGGAARVVRVGDELGGATVVEIQRDALLLRRDGRTETLDLQSAGHAQAQSGLALPASPDSAAAEGGRERGPSSRAAARPAGFGAGSSGTRASARGAPGGGRGASSRGGAGAAQTNDEIMAQLALQARFVPSLDNQGKLRGVAVLNVVPDSMLERLGLQSDDVVTAIQGVAVDSSGAALNAARSLNLAQPVTLAILRHGAPTTLVVDLQGH